MSSAYAMPLAGAFISVPFAGHCQVVLPATVGFVTTLAVVAFETAAFGGAAFDTVDFEDVVAGTPLFGAGFAAVGFAVDGDSGNASTNTDGVEAMAGALATDGFAVAFAGNRKRSPGWIVKGSAMPFARARSTTFTPLREAMPYSESPACTTTAPSFDTGTPADGYTFTVAGVQAHRQTDITRIVERRTTPARGSAHAAANRSAHERGGEVSPQATVAVRAKFSLDAGMATRPSYMPIQIARSTDTSAIRPGVQWRHPNQGAFR